MIYAITVDNRTQHWSDAQIRRNLIFLANYKVARAQRNALISRIIWAVTDPFNYLRFKIVFGNYCRAQQILVQLRPVLSNDLLCYYDLLSPVYTLNALPSFTAPVVVPPRMVGPMPPRRSFFSIFQRPTPARAQMMHIPASRAMAPAPTREFRRVPGADSGAGSFFRGLFNSRPSANMPTKPLDAHIRFDSRARVDSRVPQTGSRHTAPSSWTARVPSSTRGSSARGDSGFAFGRTEESRRGVRVRV